MPTEQHIAEITRLLDQGMIGQAAHLSVRVLGELVDQPKVILRILGALDKTRRDQELDELAIILEGMGLLPVQSAIFRLRVKFRAEDFDAALGIIDQILLISPTNVEALRTGGRIGNANRNDELALHYWLPLAEAMPDDREAALQAARILMRQGRFYDAMKWGARAAEIRPELSEPLHIALRAGMETEWPEICDSLLARLFEIERVAALKFVGQFVERHPALTVARSIAHLRSNIPVDLEFSAIVERVAAAWTAAGLDRELASKDIEAAAYYCAVRLCSRDTTDATRAIDRLNRQNMIGIRHALQRRDFPAVIRYGSAATQIDPECLEAWRALGRAFFSEARHQDAIAAFRRCIELNADDSRAWLSYGVTLNAGSQRLLAADAFRAAMKRATGDDTRKEASAALAALVPALLREAREVAAAGEILQAWKIYDAAVTTRNQMEESHSVEQVLLRLTREKIRQLWAAKSPDVVPLCRAYSERLPGDRQVEMICARTLMALRSYADALPIWERLCKQAPNDEHIHLQIARCCRALGLLEKGTLAAGAASRIDPQLREAAEISELLRSRMVSENLGGATNEAV